MIGEPPLRTDWLAHSSITRRQFLRSSFGAAGVMMAPASGCDIGAIWGVNHEGIYTDRFTYRPGDTIHILCSLRSGAMIPFEFVRMDVIPNIRVATIWAIPENFGNPNPGPTEGPIFLKAAELPASELATGLYRVQIPPESILAENRVNAGNGFPSNNSVAYFVVTPRVAGSSSRLLWIHDSLTGVAYGSFAGHSIYPTAVGGVPTVNYCRPGLDRGITWTRNSLPFLLRQGYEFEFIDLVDLATTPPGYLDAYDLVCCVGQFEYVPNEVIIQLAAYQAGGGNLFSACNEFGIFRVRLDPNFNTLTAYKWDYLEADPYYSSGNPDLAPYVAGIGMCSPASPYETEIIGQTVWPAHRVSVEDLVSLPVYNLAEAGWILEGTGIGAGDAFPAAFNEYASGLCLEFNEGEPIPILGDEMRLPEGLVVWGARPSKDGIDWRTNPGRPTAEWPALESTFATATLQQRSSGAQVVSLPSHVMSEWHVGQGNPVYDQMILNIFARLSVRA